jgi:hypothetical protein
VSDVCKDSFIDYLEPQAEMRFIFGTILTAPLTCCLEWPPLASFIGQVRRSALKKNRDKCIEVEED